VLEALAEAEGAVGRRRTKPSGTLRLGASVVFGRLHIVPRLARFLARYPDVTVDLMLSDGFTDLVGEGIDLSIRVGHVTDPGLVGRRIGLSRRIAVATPKYLKTRGTPKTPSDLVGHDCIIYTRLATGSQWSFMRAGETIDVEVAGRFHVNSTEGVREAALAGLGIGLVPRFHFGRELDEGALKIVLADYQPSAFPTTAVYPSRRYVPLKVRAMIDFLADEFKLDPRLSDHAL
jgi:DNA-binding transcriptional LysR family regulator